MSARNLIIKKIFKFVIFTTTIFALGSVLFSLEQKRFTSYLEKKESFVTSCCMLSDEEIDSFMKEHKAANKAIAKELGLIN